MTDFRLDPDQQKVCDSTARHLLVTAPPGTGKTFLAIRLAGEIAATLPKGAKVLLLTFSNQARTQLEREASQRLGSESKKRIEITNYHRFFWRAVLAYRRALCLPMELDIGSVESRRQAVEDLAAPLLENLSSTIVDVLAEHAFEMFHDERTPSDETLQRLTTIVTKEQRAGRLVFGDLGALFWKLLNHFPNVEDAFCARYPVVIADEHQDASALQDAVVRRLGRKRLIIFADDMQLIYGFRGASEARLDSHKADADQQINLSTSHRWHGKDHLAKWLLAVRSRLLGNIVKCETPSELVIQKTEAIRGLNAVKSKVQFAVLSAFKEGNQSIAVLSRGNKVAEELRGFLSNKQLWPRYIGSGDFEESRHDLEKLPSLGGKDLALHTLDRVQSLIPTLSKAKYDQVKKRITESEVNLSRAGAEAKIILEPLTLLYQDGHTKYFEVLEIIIRKLCDAGHHSPHTKTLRALRETVDLLKREDSDVGDPLTQYADSIIKASQIPVRTDKGLFVMTIHQAKGKEFDSVILADVSARYFPDDDETRRLLYVAITRATNCWTVIAPEGKESPLMPCLDPIT